MNLIQLPISTKNTAVSKAIMGMDARTVPNGASMGKQDVMGNNTKESWRVGWLAHGPLRDRCPRAAPNPSDSRMRELVKSLNGPMAPKEKYWGSGTGALSGP